MTQFKSSEWDGMFNRKNYDLICDTCGTRLGTHVGTSCAPTSARDVINQPPAIPTLAQRYPKYYKPVGELTEVDVYAVHKLFSLEDMSGCIHHASKKLLLSGVRTGGKTKQQDIREARDTLNRWLELNGEAE